MKIVKQSIFCVVPLLIAMDCTLAHITDPDTGLDFQYKAQLAEVAPVVDGLLDDPVWKEVKSAKLDLEIREDRLWGESDDFKGTFAAVWRSASIYLAVQLSDDHVDTHQEKLSLQDHLEISLDVDHTGRKSDFYRYTLPVGEDAMLSDSSRVLIAWGTDGQSLELRFDLGRTPNKEDIIGFGIYYNDVDDGQLNHKFAWAPVGQTEPENSLADLVFTAKFKRGANQKAMQWGRIKQLY